MNPGHTTSTGLRIGRAYVPPPRPMRSADEYRIQSALIGKPEPRRWQEIVITAVLVIVLSAIPFIN